MQYGSFTSILALFLATLILVSSVRVVGAEVMGSTNYQIQSDSINVGGGLSTSTNYRQESTVGEMGTGNASSSNFWLHAGYQQMQEVYIAISGSTTTILTPAIGGITGGTSNGSTTVTVITDSPSGYALSIEAALSPAMQSSSGTLADYAPLGANPDFSFTTNSADAHFGFSPDGVDVVQRFLDNGSSCNAGSSNGLLTCWDGLSTTGALVSSGVGANHPDGATTTINFRVGIGNTSHPTAGTYVATTTVTAIPL